jgi:23S rRNA (uracil1939-C5)-methyltransferase
VADAAVNLDEFDNVALYEATEAEALPALGRAPDLAVFHSGGLSPAAVEWLAAARPGRVVVAAEVGTLAKEAKRLAGAGYRPGAFQPVDVGPQGFGVEVVSRWAI